MQHRLREEVVSPHLKTEALLRAGLISTRG